MQPGIWGQDLVSANRVMEDTEQKALSTFHTPPHSEGGMWMTPALHCPST